MDKLEQAMQNENFWIELTDASFGKVVLRGKNANTIAGNEYYEISSKDNTDGDFAITLFKTYEKVKTWFDEWQGEGFYDYLVELYEKQLNQRNGDQNKRREMMAQEDMSEQRMVRERRKIQFDVALELIEKVYSDYCKDADVTREQAYEFYGLVQDMIRFSTVLDNQIKESSKEYDDYER